MLFHEVKENSVGKMESVREGVGEEGNAADEPTPTALEGVVGGLGRHPALEGVVGGLGRYPGT